MLKHIFSPISFDKHSVRLNLSIATIYILTGLLGQTFAISPGNITPIWLPSGIMFAFALKYGSKVWPGVFIGAFFGNVWAYFTLDNLVISVNAILAATLNGVGDVLAIVGMVVVLNKILKGESPFVSVFNFSVFVFFGGILGALISAALSVSGLTVFGFVSADNYWVALTNWWIGDGVGVLLLAPFLHSILSGSGKRVPYFPLYLALSLSVFLVLSADIFGFTELNDSLFKLLILSMPAAFALMLFGGQRAVYIVQLFIVSLAVGATYSGRGPFVDYQLVSPLVELQIFIAVFSMVVFVIALLVEQKRLLINQLTAQKQELENLYRHDHLTNLWNRYRIEEYLQIELGKFKRKKESFVVFIIDIDDFKKINDNYGHLDGDRVLVELSHILSNHTRSGDLVGRWGGEEFIIISAESNQEHSANLATKLIALIQEHDFKLKEPLTVSVGYTQCKENDTTDSILVRADEGLYYAKSHGKNQAMFNA